MSEVAELGQSLYDAKLSVPTLRFGAVSRRSVIDAARASDCRVVAVTAPAGYGKSTLLAEWARAEDRPVAWVSLDGFDDDPAALLALLASAYGRIAPGSADLVADMGGLGMSALGRAAPRLAAALRTSPFPFVLMVDDLHELRSPDCHDVLGVVLAGIGPRSQLVAASRFEQPHVPRLRASGEVMEVGADDLALDVEGARRIFAAEQLQLSPASATEVTRRTEGWPAGLYLAAVIARENRSEAASVSGEDPYVADYLYRESLTNQPDDVQRFLRRTSVLDQLSGSLCDAVLQESDANARLRHLEATSMFVVPLDRRRDWYRYHGLFREFLFGELQRVEPEIISKLHLRAADWYESNGSPRLALEHLLNTDERDRCVQLVSTLVLPTYSAGHMSTAQQWLHTLGDAGVESYPPLAIQAGWTSLLTGQTSEAERWAAIADAASWNDVPLDGSASFDSGRAMLRAVMCAAGPEQMLADSAFAVDQEPRWSPWRDTALLLLAEADLLAGDPAHAAGVFVETSDSATQLGNTDTIVCGQAELALLAMDREEWEQAEGHLRSALATIDKNRMHDYVVSVIAFAAAARLALHRGDKEDANRQIARAMRGRPTCTYVIPWLSVRVRLVLAKVHVALADVTTARHLLREIDDILRIRPALGTLVDEVSALRTLLSTTSAEIVTGGPPLSAAEIRLLPYLQTHLTMREIADRLYVSHNTVRSQVGSIYRKLGVSSRTDAVEHATTIGLLGG